MWGLCKCWSVGVRQSGSSAVHDTVVNQLLAKLDGVEQLNNILVIGQCFLFLILCCPCSKADEVSLFVRIT